VPLIEMETSQTDIMPMIREASVHGWAVSSGDLATSRVTVSDAASREDAIQTLQMSHLGPRSPSGPQVRYSDVKVANRDVRDFGWEIAHGAVTRRPPISLDTMVPRTEGYTYDVGVWDSSIVQGPFSVAPCQTVKLRFATFASLYVAAGNGP
jgi:hypothetical protein